MNLIRSWSRRQHDLSGSCRSPIILLATPL